MESKRLYLRDKVGEEELLLLLSEEASELAQAALKPRRTNSIVNPARITMEEAHKNLLEEVADVFNCLSIMCLDINDIVTILNIADYKMERWIEAIKKKEAEENE